MSYILYVNHISSIFAWRIYFYEVVICHVSYFCKVYEAPAGAKVYKLKHLFCYVYTCLSLAVIHYENHGPHCVVFWHFYLFFYLCVFKSLIAILLSSVIIFLHCIMVLNVGHAIRNNLKSTKCCSFIKYWWRF